MTKVSGHVSRSNHTHTTPSWDSSARYAGMDRRPINQANRAYQNAMNQERNNASAAHARLKDKLADRKIDPQNAQSRLMEVMQGLLTICAARQ